jgi:putative YpdA family bacillithiol system oxidoreductase
MQYDLIIVGGGPVGLICGIEANRAGLHYLILEKGVLANSLYHFPTNMTFFSTSVLLEIGNVPFISHTEKPTRSEALEYFRRVTEAFNLNIQFYEIVHRIGKNENGLFTVYSNKKNYSAKNVVIATGFYDQDVRLNIKGEELPKVKHYFEDAHPYYRKKVAIIGAGNSAIDAALECWQKGAQVSMVIRDSELKQNIKYWVKPNIENRIKEGSVKAYFNATVSEIKINSLIFNQEGQTMEIENDFVLALTGYQPDYNFLANAGVLIQDDENKTPYTNSDTLESNIPGLYLAGVILGGMHTGKYFIETSKDHGQKIINHILSK